jgi:hypothetical protein
MNPPTQQPQSETPRTKPPEDINTVGWPAELMQNHVFECHEEIRQLRTLERELADCQMLLKAEADAVTELSAALTAARQQVAALQDGLVLIANGGESAVSIATLTLREAAARTSPGAGEGGGMKTYQAEIDATHPENDNAGAWEIDADMLAMKLVGERHEKRELVNLVRWLILRKPTGLIQPLAHNNPFND